MCIDWETMKQEGLPPEKDYDFRGQGTHRGKGRENGCVLKRSSVCRRVVRLAEHHTLGFG